MNEFRIVRDGNGRYIVQRRSAPTVRWEDERPWLGPSYAPVMRLRWKWQAVRYIKRAQGAARRHDAQMERIPVR